MEQFDWLTAALGLDTFRKLFPVILTDNGSEFKSTPKEMEFTVDGQRRTRIYYCDPQAYSWQKPHIERKNHSISICSPSWEEASVLHTGDIVLLLNHINSTRRSKLGGKGIYRLAARVEFLRLKEVMGLGDTGRRGGSDTSIAEKKKWQQ